ncbi:PP2C family protein-serine/threonine phosphatase [Actinomadura craniellae]
MLREGNEDSAYAGAHLLAVADGMGGHVGGEIASAAAIETLKPLDTDVPAADLLAALEHTVKAANEKLHHIVESDPALQGMGTTLTAMLWAGNQVALVHIGDSRAYLLRDGSLFQITHDHTLVQSLVDEGRITQDEAASHPQRSLLLRALDGRGEVDPDLSIREAKVGDRYLLCSDGLSGVVTAETIFQVLSDYAEPEQAIRQLIDLANRGGGPDNITCVVADVIDLSQQPPLATGPQLAGAAANVASQPEAPGGPPPTDTPAQRARDMRDTMPQPPVMVDEMPPPAPAPAAASPAGVGAPPPPRQPKVRRRWGFLIGGVGLFGVLVIGTAAFGVQHLRNDGFYAQAENGRLVVYKGSPDSVLGLSMSSKVAGKDQPNPPILVEELPKPLQDRLKTEPLGLSSATAWRGWKLCRYSLLDDGGKVAMFRGATEQEQRDGCARTKITTSDVVVADLPTPEQDSLSRPQPIPRAQAQARLAQLKTKAEACASGDPAAKQCPGKPR